MRPRSRAPVFVCGFPRSGTTLLYHMLLSAGGFACYRTETWAFDLLVPRFGDLGVRANRVRLMDAWLRSPFFARSGLDAATIRDRVLAGCRNGGEFLEIVMGAIAGAQGACRWADCTPTHLLHLPEIKRTIPDALIVHIIRDGRDAALSYERQGWVHPLPWDRNETLAIAALCWEWTIRRGRAYRPAAGADYLEVRYEDLVREPRPTLARIGAFIDQPLDYGRIQEVGIGSVRQPNTSFQPGAGEAAFNPVGRWKALPAGPGQRLDRLVGGLLEELGYERATAGGRLDGRDRRLRRTYVPYFELRHRLKIHTPLGRFLTNTSLLRSE